jgi:hypothetical protein
MFATLFREGEESIGAFNVRAKKLELAPYPEAEEKNHAGSFTRGSCDVLTK